MTAFLQAIGSSGALDALSAASSVGSGISGIVTGRRNAHRLEQAGAAAESDAMREAAQLVGAQRAAYAKGGVRVDAGTPLDVLAETAAQESLNALRLKYGYTSAAYDEKAAGRAALTGGLFQGATTLLTSKNRRASTLPPERLYRVAGRGDLLRPPTRY